MEMTMRLAALACLLPLCACVTSAPAVSSYNGDSVTVQAPGLEPTSPPGPDEVAVANEVCASGGKTARYASKRMVADARVEFLFLCA